MHFRGRGPPRGATEYVATTAPVTALHGATRALAERFLADLISAKKS